MKIFYAGREETDHGSLYIMRHGKTDWNVMHKLQGQTDIPLNEEGIAMAKEAALNCRDTHFDICFCSPLIRARMTAETVLKDRDIPVVYDDRLKEMCFGEYEGIENSFDIPDCNVNVLFFHPDRYTADRGAESLDALMARTAAFLDEQVYPLIAKGKDVLIIGHGAMNSSIVCQVLKMPLADFWKKGIENCRLMKLI